MDICRAPAGALQISSGAGDPGADGVQITGSDLILDGHQMFGGSGGGASREYNGSTTNIRDGGNGGGSIVLIAPTVTLAASATLNTSGDNGEAGISDIR